MVSGKFYLSLSDLRLTVAAFLTVLPKKKFDALKIP